MECMNIRSDKFAWVYIAKRSTLLYEYACAFAHIHAGIEICIHSGIDGTSAYLDMQPIFLFRPGRAISRNEQADQALFFNHSQSHKCNRCRAHPLTAQQDGACMWHDPSVLILTDHVCS